MKNPLGMYIGLIQKNRLTDEEKKRLVNNVESIFGILYEEFASEIGFDVLSLPEREREFLYWYINGFMDGLNM